jgi:hypothetical protein
LLLLRFEWHLNWRRLHGLRCLRLPLLRTRALGRLQPLLNLAHLRLLHARLLSLLL